MGGANLSTSLYPHVEKADALARTGLIKEQGRGAPNGALPPPVFHPAMLLALPPTFG